MQRGDTMIRVNLVSSLSTTDRHLIAVRETQVTALCAVLLILAAGGIGWRTWQVRDLGARTAEHLDATQLALGKLSGVVGDVDRLEGRRDALRARLAAVTEIRRRGDAPARVLGRLSRSVPDGVWLSRLDQETDSAVVQGAAMTLGAVTTFFDDLAIATEGPDGVTVVFSRAETTSAGELVRFEVRIPFSTANSVDVSEACG